MRETYYEDVKGRFLGKSFDYLVVNGLENTSLRDLCKATKISLGSVYYWFEGKEDLFTDATEFGLKNVIEGIFEYVFNSMDNLDAFFKSCLEEIGKYKNQIRFICQVASSPVYGERLKSAAEELVYTYDRYSYKLAKKLGCMQTELKPLIYLFVSTVIDYSIWEDEEKAGAQISYLKKLIMKSIGNMTA